MSRGSRTGFSLSALQQALPPFSPDTIVWVAYSGGCDSHVLLHALAQLCRQQPFTLKAVYINHGLSPNAAAWGRHCLQVCEALGVTLELLTVDASSQPGESPEEAARRARYQAFKELLQTGDILCTAHHQDDQAETLLLQLLRGAGPKGLAAMPLYSPLGRATQWRPLLAFSQAQLQSYAQAQQLHWIEDESNSDTGLNRNFIRHEIMPRLRQRWPAADATISRSAAVCGEAATLLDVLAAQDYQLVRAAPAADIDIDKLFTLDNARRKNVLRYRIRTLGLPLPSEIKLQHVLHDVLEAAPDKNPSVKWPGAEARRYQGLLYLMKPATTMDRNLVLPWDAPEQPLVLADGARLVISDGGQLARRCLANGRITVRFRRGGEYMHPPGRGGGCSLKQLLQEAGIPPWRRNTLPLVYIDDELAAVAGLCVDTRFQVQGDEPGCNIELLNPVV